MQGNQPIKKVVKTSLAIYILIVIILGALAFIDYSWVVGFAVGGGITIGGYFLRILLIKKFLKTVRSKRKGFWIGWGLTWLTLLYHGVMVILVIIIDNSVQGYRLFYGGMQSVLKPIHMITYMAGIGIIPVGTLVAHVLIKRR